MTASALPSWLVVGVVLLIGAVALALRPSDHRSLSPTDGGANVSHSSNDTNRWTERWRHRLARLLAAGGQGSPAADPAALAEWCDDLSRRIRAGASLREALGRAVPRDAACRHLSAPVRRAVERGVTAQDAVGRLAGTSPDVELTAAVLATAARLGGSPAAAIDRTAATLRQRSADRDERLVQSAQARLSAHVLTVLPVAILGVLLVTDADVRTAVTAPVGAACVTVGLALNVVGWYWMRRVVGR